MGAVAGEKGASGRGKRDASKIWYILGTKTKFILCTAICRAGEAERMPNWDSATRERLFSAQAPKEFYSKEGPHANSPYLFITMI